MVSVSTFSLIPHIYPCFIHTDSWLFIVDVLTLFSRGTITLLVKVPFEIRRLEFLHVSLVKMILNHSSYPTCYGNCSIYALVEGIASLCTFMLYNIICDPLLHFHPYLSGDYYLESFRTFIAFQSIYIYSRIDSSPSFNSIALICLYLVHELSFNLAIDTCTL